MMLRSTLLALICLFICACRYDAAEEGDDAGNTKARVLPTNDEILTKAYDTSYQVPENFFLDDRAGTPQSYSLYHVKDPSVSYELCTDTYADANEWEAQDNASRPVNGVFVTSIENNRYFEFVRELSYPDSVGNVPEPTSPGFARVFKCSYVMRDGADRNLRNGYAGRLNVRPLTPDVIKAYSEYMWQFTFFWPARKKVLDSYSVETGDSYQNTLVLAFLTNQGNGRCDLIELVDWVFSVDKISGDITKSFRPIQQMEARQVDGIPQLCTQ